MSQCLRKMDLRNIQQGSADFPETTEQLHSEPPQWPGAGAGAEAEAATSVFCDPIDRGGDRAPAAAAATPGPSATPFSRPHPPRPRFTLSNGDPSRRRCRHAAAAGAGIMRN